MASRLGPPEKDVSGYRLYRAPGKVALHPLQAPVESLWRDLHQRGEHPASIRLNAGNLVIEFYRLLGGLNETGGAHQPHKLLGSGISPKLRFDCFREVGCQRDPVSDYPFGIGNGARLAARCKDAGDLREVLPAIPDVMDDIDGEDHIERFAGKVEVLGSTLTPIDVGCGPASLL